MNIYALIPIKHNSERVPEKNYRDFNGKPLFFWIINTLLNSNYINKIIIDTDSLLIKELIPKYFNENMNRIIIYDRPIHLHGGHVATNDLFVNVIRELNLDADYYFQTHTTNPLLKTSTVNKALEQFLIKKKEGYDSLFSVNTHHTRFYDKNGDDLNHNRFKLIPTQDLEPIYEENSCIYIFTKKSLFEFNARIAKKAFLFRMSNIESTDIDWPEDFELAKILHKYYTEL
jgi:N-acylneuraminate cytidylyltransferase